MEDLISDKPKKKTAEEKRVRILIHATETEKEDVAVGINDYVYQIQRGKEVEVPVAVLNVLNDAVMTKSEPGPDGKSMVERSFPRFTVQVFN